MPTPYENCIASGESPASCAATFGAPGTADIDRLEDLDAFVGLTLVSAPGGFEGILKKAARPGGQPFYWLQASDGSKKILTSLTEARTLIEPSSLQGVLLGTGVNPVTTSIGQQSESDIRRLFGLPSGGGGTTSFASTQAAQAQAEAFARQQAETLAAANLASEQASREFQTEQNRLAEEAALKRGRLSTLTDLIQSFVASQAQARDTLATARPDAFRFAAVAGGAGPFGVTPQQGFTEQLQQFASAPVPTADPNASLPSIQSAIQGLTGVSAPLNPQVFGAAGGASIPAPPPGQSIAVKVGERGEEILRVTAQGVEVIPLAGGMQEGGAIGFPFEPIEFDTSTLLPFFQRTGIFGGLGFNRVPTAQTGRQFGPFGAQRRVPGVFEGLPGEFGTAANPLGANPFRASTLNTLGIDPNLIRFGADKRVFFSDPRTGELRPFSGLEQFQESGFDFGNVVSVRPEDRGQFQFGSTLGPGFDPAQVGNIGGTSLFADLRTPIFEPTTGTLLPNPSQVAGDLNRLRLTDPATFNLLLNAYENAVTGAGNSAGFSAANVLAVIQGALPFGQERTLTGLR